MASQSPNSQIIAGKYELLRLVRRGGMGAVYEARNTGTRGRCALKLLRPEFADSEDFKRRFFREARACGVVSSDHIVKIFDSGTDLESGCPYLVMEFLEGEDLEATKARLGALNPSACLKIVLQASIGLARAHEAGIVHRDVKPANLFLTTNDAGDIVVKILDFGVAKMKMETLLETSSGITRSHALLGTPLYMSPEQCKGAASIDARSDVWSLGVVLWELLSGTSPFSQPRALGALMASIITEDLPLLQDAAPWVSPKVAEVVHRAMSRDVKKRYEHAAELRDALLGVTLGGQRLHESELTPVTPRDRAVVARRLELRDTSMLSPSQREGIVVGPNGSLRPAARISVPVLAGVVSVAAALGAVAAAQFSRPARQAPSGVGAPASAPQISGALPAHVLAPAAGVPSAAARSSAEPGRAGSSLASTAAQRPRSQPDTGPRRELEKAPAAASMAPRVAPANAPVGSAPSASAAPVSSAPPVPAGMRSDTREFPP